MSRSKRFSIGTPPEVHGALELTALELGMTINNLVNRVLVSDDDTAKKFRAMIRDNKELTGTQGVIK